MPLIATCGAASAQGFGEFAQSAAPVYIEDVFSCFLYSGTNAAQTITNNIDLSTYGGVVWQKARISAIKHRLFSTNMTLGRSLSSNSIFAEDTAVNITSYSTTGFTVAAPISDTGENYVTWTFRKQPKFFDVQTWTGSGVNRTIAHNLGSVPGCIIVKCIDDDFAWAVYHRSLANTQYLVLNSTAAAATGATWWNSTTPTSAVFSLGTDSTVNALNKSYIAYIYAHNAGGFGLTGTDNVISCGSYTGTGSVPNNITLGFEPQWLLVKSATYAGQEWGMFDSMRGLVTGSGGDAYLYANSSGAEGSGTYLAATATGFSCEDASARYNNSGDTYIYIAIRRGPMKVPTSGTSVFAPVAQTIGTGSLVTTGFVTDAGISRPLSSSTGGLVESRLTGNRYMQSSNTDAESAGSASWTYMNGYSPTPWTGSGLSSIAWTFKRAPSFFDEVCYTGNGGINNVQNHSLADSIGMLIIKRRDSTGNWSVFVKESGGNYSYWNSSGTGTGQGLNGTGAPTGTNYSGYNSYLTSTTFNAAQIAGSNDINANGGTYVAYLFATCAGVSKVGSYTGDNSDGRIIDCGFTAGARFILIRRTDQGGQWAVWDSARGIVSGSDPYLMLNNTLAEVAGYDDVDVHSTGFIINASSPGIPINVAGSTYIFLAIA